MRRLFVGLAMVVLVAARPELYREKEDFQYSRSSTDEGSKSGYYDAQRGNMGGNYERAHNMDNLAQHQMGGLIKQVQGEIGDGSKTRSGNVFTSANSQGIYGSGRYDLSALGNRNFQDGTNSYEGSQVYSSAANRAYESHSTSQNNARYSTNSQSHDSGHSGFKAFQSGNLQEAQNAYGGAANYNQGAQAGLSSSRLYTHSGYQGSNEYEHSNLNQQASSDFGANNRQSQVRILLRPGSRVAVPVNAQVASGSRTASLYDRTENSEAEVLNADDQQTAYTSSNKPKHYESSYSYRKQWEKHDTKPVSLSTVAVNPIPVNSELYDSSRLHHGSHYENENFGQLSSQARQQAFNAQQQVDSTSQVRNQAEFNSRQHSTASSNSNAFSQNAYNLDADTQSANLFGAVGSKPKSYQSSYSYHKSWERQGDPYVIKPAYDGQTSERLTDSAATTNQNSFQNYGSRFSKSHQAYSIRNCVSECDPQNSHYRIARSASAYDTQETQQSQNAYQQYDLGQRTQNAWENLGQQTEPKFDNLEDLGQQTQNKWDHLENLEQQTQDFGQQTQDFGQPSQDITQQSQGFGQETQDFGQKTEHKFDKIEDLGQQTQNKWDTLENLDQQTQDLSQQTEHKFDKVEDLGQQTQNKWEQSDNFDHQKQDLGQQSHDFGQQSQDFGQQTQDLGQQLQDLNQQAQYSAQQNENRWNEGQETQNSWNNLHTFGQQSESIDETKPGNWNMQEQENVQPEEIEIGQQTQNKWEQTEDQNTQDNYEGMQQQTQSSKNHSVSYWHKINNMEQSHDSFDQHSNEGPPAQNSFQTDNMNQQTQGIWDNIHTSNKGNEPGTPEEMDSHSFTFNQPDRPNGQKPLNSLWDKIDSLDNDYIGSSSLTNTPSSGINLDATTEKDMSSTLENVEKHQSNDIGRGDIGPEDIMEAVTSTTENNYFNNIHNNDFYAAAAADFHDDKKTGGDNKVEGLTVSSLENFTDTIQNTNTNQNYSGFLHKDVELTNLSKHKVQVEKTPEEVKQFSSQNTSELETLENHNHFFHKSKDENEQNLETLEKAEKELHQTQQHESDESHQTFFQHGQGFHHGQDLHHVHESHHEQGFNFNHEHGFHHEHGFNNEHGFDHDHGFNHEHGSHHEQGFNNDHGINHVHGFHHEQGVNNEHGFDHAHGFHHEHGAHQEQGFNHEHSSHHDHDHSFHNEQSFHHEQSSHSEQDFHHEQVFQNEQGLSHEHSFHHEQGFHLHNGLSHQTHFENVAESDHDHKQIQNNDGNYKEQNIQLENSGFEQHQSETHQHSTEQHTEDLNQQHQQWNEEQQNVNQFNVDFSQQSQNNFHNQFGQENMDNLEDFSQKSVKSEFDVVPVEVNQEQKGIENFGNLDILQSNKEMQLDSYQKISNKNNAENKKEATYGSLHQLIDETPLVEKHQTGLSEAQPNATSEPTIEKPGFWKSVGNKFSSAKSKVASWFGS